VQAARDIAAREDRSNAAAGIRHEAACGAEHTRGKEEF